LKLTRTKSGRDAAKGRECIEWQLSPGFAVEYIDENWGQLVNDLFPAKVALCHCSIIVFVFGFQLNLLVNFSFNRLARAALVEIDFATLQSSAMDVRLRSHSRSRPQSALRVRPVFDPRNLGYWFYERIVDWSKSQTRGPAYIHIFRKTTLRYARVGEDANRLVAQDARVGESMMMTSYVKETDEETQQKSNRTFHRICASLPPEVARRFGYIEEPVDPLQVQHAEATAAGNWDLAARLAAELARRSQRAG
jgi:hypothetical protein